MEPFWIQKERLEIEKRRIAVAERNAASFERIASVAEYFMNQQQKAIEMQQKMFANMPGVGDFAGMFKDLFPGGGDPTVGPDGGRREQNR